MSAPSRFVGVIYDRRPANNMSVLLVFALVFVYHSSRDKES